MFLLNAFCETWLERRPVVHGHFGICTFTISPRPGAEAQLSKSTIFLPTTNHVPYNDAPDPTQTPSTHLPKDSLPYALNPRPLS